jgi:hypothetical protein
MGNSSSNLNTSPVILNDSLINMEAGIPNELIFTFYIIMHGAIINFNLTHDEEDLFDNCRMFSKTGSTCYAYTSNSIQDDITILKHQLQKNLNNSSYDSINNCIKQNLKPKYIQYINSLSKSDLFPRVNFPDTKEDKNFIISNCRKTLLRVTHDKIFGTKNENNLGIFLLSVHKKELDGSLSYIKIEHSYLLNLLIISELQKFAKMFDGVVPELKSENFNIDSWSGIELSSDNKEIITIKLSKFVEIINSILKNTRKKCNYNLIDESCSKDINNPYLKNSFYDIDIENTFTKEDVFGGKNKKKGKGKGKGKIKIKNTILKKRIKNKTIKKY